MRHNNQINKNMKLLTDELNMLRRENNGMTCGLHIFASFVESSPDPVVFTDTTGKIIYVNTALEQYTGYNRDELIGKPPIILNAEENATKIQEEILSCLWRAETWCGEFLQRRKDGSKYLAEFIIFPLMQGSTPIAYASIQGDVTERKQMQQALLASEELYRKLVELSPSAICVHDLSGKIIFLNPAIVQLLGARNKNELLNRNMVDFVHPDHMQVVQNKIKQMLETGKATKPFEEKLLKLDGTAVDVETTGVPLLFQGKRALLVIATDISERKKHQELLARERERLFSLLDELPAFVYLQADDYSLSFSNRFFWQRFGVPHKGQACYEVIHGRKIPCDPCRTFEVFDTKKPLEWEWQDWKGRVYQIYNYPFYDVDESLSVLVMGFDITLRKSMEKQLKKQLLFSNAVNKIAEIIICYEDTTDVLENTVRIIGETLDVDRSLIYDVDFDEYHVKELSEWLNPNTPGIAATKGTYSLDVFIDAFTYMLEHEKWLESHIDRYSTYAVKDGSGDLLHRHMDIKSGIWFPFAFRDWGYYCLVFNQTRYRRVWRHEEIDFICACAKLVEIALQKMEKQGQIKRSQEAFFKAFNSSPALMAITSFPDGTFIDVNENYLKSCGLDRSEVIGYTVKESNVWIGIQERAKILGDLKKNKTVSNVKIKYFTKTGEERYGLFSGDVINLNGKQCCLSVINDITDLTRYEIEISRLERLNLIGQMAAGIGHEIRNPMTSVRGFLQLFSEKKELAEYKNHLNLMIDELDRANSIITEFLTLARNKPTNKKIQDLNNIIDVLYPLIQSDVTRFNINLELKQNKIPDLLLDEKEIRQLILNLCRNAMEAMPRDKTLTISTYSEGDEVVLAIKDQGSGISSEIYEKLGTPFFTTKDEGTGLGLAICYSICDRHKAVMDVKTGTQGTTFLIRFKAFLRN